ncbi:MAG: alkaline phosphatase family protein [Bryobacteraceae bacterium]
MKLITRHNFRKLALLSAVAAALLISQPAPREQVGPLPSGGFLLNSGWRLQPAGKQVPVDTLPMSSAVSRDGRFLLILNGGYNPPSISVIDIASTRELSRTNVPDAWLGLAFSPKGDFVYVGGGSRAAVYEFSFQSGVLQATRTFPVAAEAKRTNRDFIGDVAVTPDGRLIYAADLFHDSLVVINPQSGRVIERFATGRRPYRILFHPDGKSFFVSSWTDGVVSRYQTEGGSSMGNVRLGPHTTDMAWVPTANAQIRLFVAAANSNNIYSVAVPESSEMRRLETINLAMTPRQPVGMTPSALGLSTDGKRLYVACSDANAIAVVDVSPDHSGVLGFIPTGWYPTAVRELADKRIVVLNSRGLRSYPNPNGPNPLRKPTVPHVGGPALEYVGRIQTGSISFIDQPSDSDLAKYSETTLANSPYRDSKLDAPVPPSLSKIKHVIYIVKENRSYDQVMGDVKTGNGDPSLVLFGEQITPNEHKLAREFVLLDNFYVNSDVSADGHNWSTAAIAADYVQKMWPNSYASRRKLYDYEGQEPTALPPAGYLWTNARAAGISMRNYGYFVNNRVKPLEDGIQIDSVRDPILSQVTNPNYRGFDLAYPDVERAKVFLKDLADFEAKGDMPRLCFVRLGNDHTSGTAAGKIAPLSAVADNDYALGMLVEGVSKSRFWEDTAIFVVEDDAQNGPDHVDSHRSPAFAISPYAKHGAVDSSMYNTVSMLRTIEFILGLRPMTQFDAAARPMGAAFDTTTVNTPYAAEKPRIALDDRNPAASATAARSAKMDFDGEDRNDDDELNEILWAAIRGRSAPAPTPVRSYFAR